MSNPLAPMIFHDAGAVSVAAIQAVEGIPDTRPGSNEPILYGGKPRHSTTRLYLLSGAVIEVDVPLPEVLEVFRVLAAPDEPTVSDG